MTHIIRNTIRMLRGLFIFRAFLLVFTVLMFAIHWSVGTAPEPVRGFSIGALLSLPALLTALLLFIPGLQQRIGTLYLPIVLCAMILDFSIESGIAYVQPGGRVLMTLATGREISVFWASTEIILLTLVPCVLAGAAYGARGGVMAATFATLLHLGTGIVVWLTHAPVRGFMVLLPLRIGVLYAFPLITGILADTWRKEHDTARHANRQLRGYAATVEHLATSRERVRLARAMHDTLAHSLSALIIQLEAVDTLYESSPSAAKKQFDKVRQLARSGLQEARRAILDLRSAPVEELGLPGALQQLARQFSERNCVPVDWNVEGIPQPLLPVQANALYRIAEEALDNVEQHAQASQVAMRLDYTQGVTLTIQDDGQGFDPAVVGVDRYGLVGIHERAALIDGQVTFETSIDEGTTITVQIAEPWEE